MSDQRARSMLQAGVTTAAIQHFPLAAATAQCCGGSVTVLLECFAQSTLRLAVFGSGHVGRRVVSLLSDLDAQVSWYDSRPDQPMEAGVPCRPLSDLPAAVDGHQDVLILTHDHQLDYELVRAALDADVGSIGLIGSATKAKRFAARLEHDGYSEAQRARVRCPVGQRLPSKQPMAVAIAIVAELLEARPSTPSTDTALSWRQIKESLVQSTDSP